MYIDTDAFKKRSFSPIFNTPFISLLAVAAVLISITTTCQAREQHLMVDLTGKPEKKSTWDTVTDSVSSGFKKGWSTLAKPFESSDKSPVPPDPIRISTPAEPSADLYTIVAQNLEDKKLFPQAEEQYKKALKKSPKHLAAMLNYGRFLDRQGRFAEAVQWYHRAIKAHPQDTRPLNHLALCLASHNLLNEAASTMEKAIRLEPKRAVHRNNIAVILVETGNNAAAFQHLRAVHDEATTYYNLGYLLVKRGDSQAALNHFAMALKQNPELEEARIWVNHLHNNRLQSGAADTRIARRSDPRNNQPAPTREEPFTNRTTPGVQPRTNSVPPVNSRGFTPPSRTQSPRNNNLVPTQATPSPRSSTLHQPPRATAPVHQTNPLRGSSPWPRPGQNVPSSTYGRPMPTAPAQDSPSHNVSPTSQPAAQQTNGSADVRWGSFFKQPQSTGTTSHPESQQRSTTEPHDTQSNNVVYPLPPVESPSR